MASEYFEDFVAGLHAPIRSKDDLDEFPHIGALHLLDDDELHMAEDMLIAKLAEDDVRAVQPLVDILCTRAVPALAERAESSRSERMRNAATWGVAELGVDRSLPALLDRLGDSDVGVRQQVVFDLGDDPDPRAEEALENTAFTDSAGVVRSSALTKLFARRGFLLDQESFRSMLDFVERRALSPLPSVRAEAEAELRDLFARQAAGQSREQMGLDWRADREEGPLKDFVLAKFGDTPVAESRRYQELIESGVPPEQWDRPVRPPVDYAALSELTGRERKWLEDVVLSRLHDDPEAVSEAVLIGVRRAIRPLRELLPITENVPVEEIEAALRQLEG
jgi:hypothetical protein